MFDSSNLNSPRKIRKGDFLLFGPNEKTITCQLKEFIYFLYQQGAKRPLNFSYVESHGNLISNITIRENIYLDSMPSSLTDSKDLQLKKYLNRTGNDGLIKLFKKITLLDEMPDNVDDQTRKLASLTKAILRPSDYLMLEYPEKYLCHKNIELLTKALNFQQKETGQVILIFSDKTELWKDHVSYFATRSLKKQFQLIPVLANKEVIEFSPPSWKEDKQHNNARQHQQILKKKSS